MIYDKSVRTYIGGSQLEPLFLKPDDSRCLSRTRLVAGGLINRADAWIGQFPPHDAAPTPVRGVNAKTLRSVVAPIRRSKAIEVTYQLLSRPQPRWRWIAPHAIGIDGFRWHRRAFCLTNNSFKDFLLSRIIETRGAREADVSPDADHDWNDEVTLEIGPLPALSETQAKGIALDYGMRGGNARIKVRRALLCYALRRLGLDTDPAARRPQDQQIVLLNKDQISQTAQGIPNE